MPVGELATRMSAHELSVMWPAFFRHRQREQEREERRQKMKRGGGRR